LLFLLSSQECECYETAADQSYGYRLWAMRKAAGVIATAVIDNTGYIAQYTAATGAAATTAAEAAGEERHHHYAARQDE
jgi:hypothetical protein